MEKMILSETAIDEFVKHIKKYLQELADAKSNGNSFSFAEYLEAFIDNDILHKDNRGQRKDMLRELFSIGDVYITFFDANRDYIRDHM